MAKRRNFAEILSAGGFDIRLEYERMLTLLYGDDCDSDWDSDDSSFSRFVDYHFKDVPFRGTALSIDDFDREHCIVFPDRSADLDDLLNITEYVYNFACALLQPFLYPPDHAYCQGMMRHCEVLADKIGYQWTVVDSSAVGAQVLVQNDSLIQAAAEVAPNDAASDLIGYDYRKHDGDLNAKRDILLRLLNELEPHRKELERLCRKPTDRLFDLANNYSIRHNNKEGGPKHNPDLDDMDDRELEAYYDACRDLCAIAFLALAKKEQIEFRGKVEAT